MSKRLVLFYGLLLGGFCAYAPFFQSPFLSPKLLFLVLATGLGLSMLVSAKRIRIPSFTVRLWLFLVLVCLLISLIPSTNSFDSLSHIGYYTLFFLMFFIALNINRFSLKYLMPYPLFPFTLFVGGVGVSFSGILEVLYHVFLGGGFVRASGLIGNSEFYATFLTLSLLMASQLLPHIKPWKVRWGQAVMLVGIFLSLNKGTFVFLLAYVLIRLIREKKFWNAVVLFLGSSIAFLCCLDAFTMSMQSRLFLWIVSGWMFINHALLGVGIGQFGHQYMDMVYDLFQKLPFLSVIFGSFVGSVEHAHQLLFHYAAELGVIGAILIVIFIIFMLRLIFSGKHPYSVSLSFLLFKSMFTVVTTALTSMWLWVFITAQAYQNLRFKKVLFTKFWKAVVVILYLLTSLYTLRLIYSDYLYYQGRKALADQDLSKAATYFQHCAHLNPGHSDSYLSLAYLGYLNHDVQSMDSNLYQAQRLYHDVYALQLEADMRFYMHDYKRARPLYTYLHHVFPDRLGPQIKLAAIELQDGNKEAAKHHALEVLNHQPRISNPAHATYKEIAKRILFN